MTVANDRLGGRLSRARRGVGRKCAKAAEARLRQLGGLGADDSLRAQTVALGLAGLARLLDGHQLEAIGGDQLGALVLVLAQDAERVAERQLLDEAWCTAAVA